MSLDDQLYPEIEPYDHGLLAVGGPHRIYYEQVGNPDGVPVIFLHGGPGGGAKPVHRRFYDPDFYRIVLIDQRGCGRSEPLGETEDNDAQALVEDLERLRRHLGIERWVVTGGSWGSCLALLYGEAHPDRCLGFRLRGMFMGRAREIDWWWRSIGVLFPEAYDELLAALPPSEHGDVLAAYYRRTNDPDPGVHEPAVRALKRFSARTSTFRPDRELIDQAVDLAQALPLSRFFTRYCAHGFFIEEGQILRDLGRITHLPAQLVVGRYDVVAPPTTSWEVHRAWPGSELEVVVEGNHSDLEPAMAAAVRRATDRLRDRLGPRQPNNHKLNGRQLNNQ
ncbi:proline iminopeptidase [Aliidongia dinghuensis]|uniref:Proline iminopeptidase n=2 Tax=Aliidongia dinghuensis TaxID=1867774 RepID=A0A8J2YPF5_9PROT|nr:proline iminopeptidase [Aliidongia dinghuensis]